MVTTNEVAESIRNWLEDLKLVPPLLGRQHTAMLCHAYNWATSPSRLMTEKESHACQRLARYCYRRLTYRTGWYESDSGRYCV